MNKDAADGMWDNKAIIGIVEDVFAAEMVFDRLRAAGVSPGEISILLPDRSGRRNFGHEHHTKAPEGAVAGASTGGVLGGTLGLLAGIGVLAIPGMGALVAAGPLMAALSGVAAGAAVGGVAGALVGFGIPEFEAKVYEGKIRDGNVLIAVHTEASEIQKVTERILRENGAKDVSSTSEASLPRNASAR